MIQARLVTREPQTALTVFTNAGNIRLWHHRLTINSKNNRLSRSFLYNKYTISTSTKNIITLSSLISTSYLRALHSRQIKTSITEFTLPCIKSQNAIRTESQHISSIIMQKRSNSSHTGLIHTSFHLAMLLAVSVNQRQETG